MHVVGHPASIDTHLNSKTFSITQGCLNKNTEKMGNDFLSTNIYYLLSSKKKGFAYCHVTK